MVKATAIDLADLPNDVAVLSGHDPAGDGFALARRLMAPIWVFDIDKGRICNANAAACEFWNAADEADLCARDMAKDMSQTVAQRLQQFKRDFDTGDPKFHEMWTLYPDGKPSSVMVNYRGYRLPDGRIGMLCEVSGQAAEEPNNIRGVEALLHTDVMVALYRRDGKPIYLNPAARTARNHHSEPLSELFVDMGDFAHMMMELDLQGTYRHVVRVNTPQGERWFDLSSKACLDAATGEDAILLTAIDVSDLKIARDTARFLADRDQLTGCFNRAYLQTHFTETLQTQRNAPCTLIYFDVDRFKMINDIHGHETGDTVLKTIADRARATVRSGDLLARLGGDEFVIVLHDHTPGATPLEDAERIRQAISRPINLATSRIDVSISMGVTQADPKAASFTDAMRQADLALYASKSGGRGHATLFDKAMGDAARARDALETDLMAAVGQSQFTLHYQPRFDLNTHRVVSVEGLIRWQHPEKGLVMPDTFIPVCEETGMIDDLGQQVLELGYQAVKRWHAAGLDRGISLNISPRQFNNDTLLQTLERFARDPTFLTSKMELEITENVLIGDPDEIAQKLRAITHLGYQIAIDDFGTGYSNLSYISRFPLHCIKIDRSFIDQLPASAPIVSLILTLGRQIGATIVAEGVENQSQMDWLWANGCNQVQGFHLARPVPDDRLQRTIAALDRR